MFENEKKVCSLCRCQIDLPVPLENFDNGTILNDSDCICETCQGNLREHCSPVNVPDIVFKRFLLDNATWLCHHFDFGDKYHGIIIRAKLLRTYENWRKVQEMNFIEEDV